MPDAIQEIESLTPEQRADIISTFAIVGITVITAIYAAITLYYGGQPQTDIIVMGMLIISAIKGIDIQALAGKLGFKI